MHFADAAKHLKHQTPDPKTGLIEQFDGYFKLENVLVPEVRSRLIDPREYWGGAYGVAAQTQVIKQADVIALLYMLGQYPADIIAANYDYYEPRTEHGSSLSACMYAPVRVRNRASGGSVSAVPEIRRGGYCRRRQAVGGAGVHWRHAPGGSGRRVYGAALWLLGAAV